MTKSNEFWKNVIYIVLSLFVNYFVYKILVGFGNINDLILIYSWYVKAVSLFVLFSFVGLFVFLLKNHIIGSYVDEVIIEIKKVTWPQKQEIKISTIAVVVLSSFSAIILALFDSVWANLLKFVLKLFGDVL